MSFSQRQIRSMMRSTAVLAHEIKCTSCSPQFVCYVWVHDVCVRARVIPACAGICVRARVICVRTAASVATSATCVCYLYHTTCSLLLLLVAELVTCTTQAALGDTWSHLACVSVALSSPNEHVLASRRRAQVRNRAQPKANARSEQMDKHA